MITNIDHDMYGIASDEYDDVYLFTDNSENLVTTEEWAVGDRVEFTRMKVSSRCFAYHFLIGWVCVYVLNPHPSPCLLKLRSRIFDDSLTPATSASTRTVWS